MPNQTKNLFIVLISLTLTLFIGCFNSSSLTHSSTSSNLSNTESKHIASSAQLPNFALPIDCNLEQDCFIMHYVDRDPSSKAIDFGCGRQTYDGHKGTDFGISDLAVMKTGVPVLATASGTVLRVRDWMTDALVDSPEKKQAIKNRECGNGLVIDHGNGWETQYCHLRRGSVIVEPNEQVEKGAILGMVGASGLASFPHIHLNVRKDGQIIDPFVGVNSSPGCNQPLNSLWSEPLDYKPTGLMSAGFAPKQPTQTEIWSGLYKETQLSADIPILAFWVHAYGVLSGDVEKWTLIAPNGKVVYNEDGALERSYRSWLAYIGKRKIFPGVWQGKYQLWRDQSLIFEVNREVLVN
ncbi:metalloendopeptidase-like membrane protein [Xenococcus sp. PCC 7305]|uniref:M23 family metallopeptidase n=1 Tax=Xenococcus sp. PCC 7305 TaxID=102125 RepID=UPI0002AD0DCA|nr:M23 family metallopeptidase [Xenococcus sp. PCC 7305]ELS04452.1 metalloendopeptidase-like membrane protein [Xenococcus sp. PCC 7305]